MSEKKKPGFKIAIPIEPEIHATCLVIRKDGTVKYDKPVDKNNEVKKG